MREINPLKKMINNGESILGTWCILPSAGVVNAISCAGLDFIVIDMEHGAAGYEDAEHMIRAAQAEGCTPLVRVADNDPVQILHALDSGSAGVLVPHIESAEEMTKAIENIKYFPAGKRGFSPFVRAAGYFPTDTKKYVEHENKEVLTVLMIESKKGIECLDEIIDDKDVDVIFLGPYDLSQALGIPGEVEHPSVKKYLEESVKKIRAKGLAAGSFTNNLDTLGWFKKIGIQFLTYSTDTTEISRSYRNIVRIFKEGK